MIIEKLKADSLRLRKERHALATFANTVYGQAQTLAKADTKNGETPVVSDDYALRAIRSFLKTAEENIKLKTEHGRDFTSDQAEFNLLTSWLPTMVSENELKSFIDSEIVKLSDRSTKSMGIVMKALREKFGTSMDPSLASQLTKTALSS